MKGKINIIIAGHQPLILEGLRSSVKMLEDLEIVAEVNNVMDLLAVLKKKHAELIVLDIDMPLMNHGEMLQNILKKEADMKIVILSELNDKELQSSFMQKGARAFVSKSEPVETLIETLKTGCSKGFAFPEQVVLSTIRKKNAFHNRGTVLLSKRELEVASLLKEGLTNREIATRLNISVHTAHAHRKKIFQKTSTHSIVQLLNFLKGSEFLNGPNAKDAI